MFKPTVAVSVEIAPFDFREVRKAIGKEIVYDTFGSLDLPSPGAGAIEKMLCTDSVTIERRMRSRQQIAKGLSKAITEALLDLMGAQDTEMGYQKEAK